MSTANQRPTAGEWWQRARAQWTADPPGRKRLSTGEMLADTVAARGRAPETTPSASNVRTRTPTRPSRPGSARPIVAKRQRHRWWVDAFALLMGAALGVLVYWLVLG